MKEYFENLLRDGKVEKHHTYGFTGIVEGRLKKISGTAGRDVNHFYYDPRYNELDVCYGNTHYGYAHIENGLVCDNSNRSVFEIVT